jgi:AmiR/NasT family two-component response regulator
MTEEQTRADGLTRKVHSLERQNDRNHQLIKDLVEQGVLDRAQIESLEAALITSRKIGAAIGILMATDKITEPEAFDRLREVSQDSRRKLRDVADDVLITGMLA